jgi:L-ascorbate metabolism protein UlaG (beta-lactamase superfamily)
MKITYYGHSCFAVEVEGKNLLFDPFITPNEQASGIDIQSLKPDYILISHAHQDHTADVETVAQNSGARLISNYEIIGYYGGKGLENGYPLNHGGGADFDFGRVKYTNAVHSSSFADGTYGGQPGGFLITDQAGHSFYFSGDTSLTHDFSLYGEEADLAFAILCIGDNFTMGPHDAARAARMLKVSDVMGVHYDTFPYIEIDHDAARQEFSKAGVNLHLPKIGETIELP